MRLVVVLSALLLLAIAGLCWQSQRHAADSLRIQALTDENAQQTALTREIFLLISDTNTVLATTRAAEQQRTTEGEKRRDEIKQAARVDDCASRVVPDNVGRILQQRAASAAGSTGARLRP